MKYVDIDLAIFDVSGTSGVLNMYEECLLIRERNNSINQVINYMIYIQGVITFYMRKVKYYLLKKYL